VIPKWKARLDVWSEKIRSQKDNLISFLIVLRIAPFPPHWVVNVICPHVGIGVVPFWISTWLGIFGVTVIHTTIGGSLDDMTSAADFHLISWRNFFLLSAVVVGAMIPVGLRYFFKRQLASVADVEAATEEAQQQEDDEGVIIAQGPLVNTLKNKSAPLIMLSDEEEEAFSEGDSDEDVVLEAGPALVVKPDDSTSLNGDALNTSARREWRAEDLL
jgi:hypothetical protein